MEFSFVGYQTKEINEIILKNGEKESKLIISNNKDIFFMVIIYKNNSSQ